ncbi:mediator of RNA polymerase II transcription subunit 15 [Halyomorpha halys]|uniref:mediator of RNA polymerase II transcription subunit 15 n=1 Tax=Halyomorpha halys TaxID=286706 RepID=UPI0006D4D641|nr:putative uncharacterized protein DDB_G0271606 [Halyomorpha halys]
MYKLGVLLLVCGAMCQHQVTQQVQPASERQIRLEDIERDGLKSAAASQTSGNYQQPQQQIVYQQPQVSAYQQPQALPASAYQQPAALHHQLQQQQQYYQLTPAAYHQPQLSYSSQLLGGHQQQLLQPLLLPQSHPYNVPIMLIPYPLQQEVALLPKVRPLQSQPQLVTKFRPSPQIQYTNPYSNQVYQQKFGVGVKSTPAPTLKENYDQQQQQQQQQQQSAYNYKLQ